MFKKAPLISLLFTLVVSAVVLTLVLRGHPGNPTEVELNTNYWKEQGPFELSPERGRFALTYSLLENASFSFSPSLAAFVTPDLGIRDGRFVSLFPPGLSYIIMPGYWLGRLIGHSQMGSTAVIAIFALFNLSLIIVLAKKLGAHSAAATLAGLTFLFASPAFTYSATLYQHHVTTSLLLISLGILLFAKSNWWLWLVWFLTGAAIVVDSPNALFFLPVGIFGLVRLFELRESAQEYNLSWRPLQFLTFFAGLFPLLLLAYFNQQSYGNPWQLGGTIAQVTQIAPTPAPLANNDQEVTPSLQLEPTPEGKKTSVGFFKTRNLASGAYTLFLAPDRGMLFFTPVLFLSFFGLRSLLRRRPKTTALLLGTIGIIALVYSMWGDPYGGWAFGSRYLIPVYALLCLFLAEALTHFRKNIAFIFFFAVLCTYSVAINTIGVLTTSANPPLVELRVLQQEQGSTVQVGYFHNLQQLEKNSSKSYAFQTFFQSAITAKQYAGVLITVLLLLISTHLVWLVLTQTAQKTGQKEIL